MYIFNKKWNKFFFVTFKAQELKKILGFKKY